MPGLSLRNTSDFDRYLGCPEAQSAEMWELQALLVLRRGIGRELSVGDYERLRGDLSRKIAESNA